MKETARILELLGIAKGETIQAGDFRRKLHELPPAESRKLRLDNAFQLDAISIALKRQHPELSPADISRHLVSIVRDDLTVPAIGEEDISNALEALEKRNKKWRW